MSKLGAQYGSQQKPVSAAEEPRSWRGHVMRLGPGGTEWARLAIPEHVLMRYIVGSKEPPNTRGIAIAKIETELGGDSFVTGRGWPK